MYSYFIRSRELNAPAAGGGGNDRFLAMVMLGLILPASFGPGCLGTALCVFPED